MFGIKATNSSMLSCWRKVEKQPQKHKVKDSNSQIWLFGYGIILKMPWKTRIKWMARCCDYKLHTQCSRHIYYFLCFSLLIHFKASHESWNLCVSGLHSLLWVLKAARGSCVFSLDLYFLTPSRLWTTVLSVPLCGASLYWPSLLTSWA